MLSGKFAQVGQYSTLFHLRAFRRRCSQIEIAPAGKGRGDI